MATLSFKNEHNQPYIYICIYILNSQHNEQLQHSRLTHSQQWQQRNSILESAPFTTTGIRAALRTSRNDTSPGLDDIPNRVLKIPELEGEVTDMLIRHSKALNNENTIPDDWRKSVIVSIPKKGNSTALGNQRGIAKTCSSAKLFNKVLLSRLKPIIDPQLSQCQSGFRAGRSTTEQLMALRCVIDTCRVTNMTASLVFVDFRKAFDTLHRLSIPVILSQYNVPICLISDITQMYSDTSACVSTEQGPTEWFKTTSGVLQDRYAITVPIHCSIGLCTDKDTTGRCWFCGLQTEWQTASHYPYRRSRIR